MKRAPSHLVGVGRKNMGELVRLPRRGPDDAACRRCDDSGVIPVQRFEWQPCTCKAGAAVLDQLAQRAR